MASVPPFTRFLIVSIKEPMLCVLIAAVDSSAPPSSSVNSGFGGYGIVFWLLLVLAAISVSITIERILLYRREQIDFAQFLAGVRTVLKRDNVLEALSICEATPGPVARLVKAAILAHFQLPKTNTRFEFDSHYTTDPKALDRLFGGD